MKRTIAVALLFTGLGLGGFTLQAGQVNVGVSIRDGNLQSFYLAVGNHYRISPQVVIDLRTRHRLLDEELPVVFFLAARAGVRPQVVIDLRMEGRPWLDVALHLGLSPEIFFIQVGTPNIGPPYGNAYGYYRQRGLAGDWRALKLNDREVIDLVNLRFMSEYHGLPPDEIIGLRGKEESFISIHADISKRKGTRPADKNSKKSPPAKPKKKK